MATKIEIEALRTKARAWLVSVAPDISEASQAAFVAAIATRGRAAGRMKRTPPKSGTLEHAAWLGVMTRANPYKLSVCALMFLTNEQRAVFQEIEAAMESVPRDVVARMDADRFTLERLGAW